MRLARTLVLPALLAFTALPLAAPARADEEEDARRSIREAEEALRAVEARLAELAEQAARRRKALDEAEARTDAAAKEAERVREEAARKAKEEAAAAKGREAATLRLGHLLTRLRAGDRTVRLYGAGRATGLEIVEGETPGEVRVYDLSTGERVGAGEAKESPEVGEAVRAALEALGRDVGEAHVVRGRVVEVVPSASEPAAADLATEVRGLREDVRGLTKEIRALRTLLNETLER